MSQNIDPFNKSSSLLPSDAKLVKKKAGVARIAYSLLLIYFRKEQRFFKDVPSDILATLLIHQDKSKVSTEDIMAFFSNSRKINRYKQEIRSYLEVKSFTQDLRQRLVDSIVDRCLREYDDEELISDMKSFLKTHHYEYPSDTILRAIILKAKHQKEESLFCKIATCFNQEHIAWIDERLLSSNQDHNVYQQLRQGTGASGRQYIQDELHRLSLVRKLPIETLTFINDIHPRYRDVFRRRFLSDTPERTKRRPNYRRYGLAGLYCYERSQIITDNCVEHLINFVHQIKKRSNAQEERLIQDAHKGKGLELLYQIAEINRDNPKEVIEQAVYSIVPQDQIDTVLRMRYMLKSIKTRVRDSLIKRYSRVARATLFAVLDALEFCSSNNNFLNALTFIKLHQHSKAEFYSLTESVPMDNILTLQEREKVLRYDQNQEHRVCRKDYEYAVFHQLQKKLKHKEVWVKGSIKYRNPDEDLPQDFDVCRDEYYQKLRLPLSSDMFIQRVKDSMISHMMSLDNGFPQNKLVKIISKHNKPWIKVSPIEKKPEPHNIERLKQKVLNKWGVIDLLDVLKEVDLREDITQGFITVGNREILDRESIRTRLLLCVFAIGTNTGLKRISGASLGAVTYEDLRHIKRYFLNPEDLRDAISHVVNAIFRIRDPAVWGVATSVCGSDSIQIESYDQNLMTQWHPRYHGSGVMIYWHVNTQSVCIYSQLKTCTSSEVASMLQGLLDHQTEMDVQEHSTDSHGKSDLGFALTYLLGFDLLPRYKSLGAQKLYCPTKDLQTKHVTPILTREIDWSLIAAQYDEMVRHAAALKIGTAQADAFVRKFSRSNYGHPTFKAFIELGQAIKTIFICRYLHSLELRQQIQAGLNVVENWNSANRFIYYGKSGEFATNSRDDQELSMLCLHLLQVCITYINMLLVQEIFMEQDFVHIFQVEDFRALTPLFYHHINPYGVFILDLKKRLNINAVRRSA